MRLSGCGVDSPNESWAEPLAEDDDDCCDDDDDNDDDVDDDDDDDNVEDEDEDDGEEEPPPLSDRLPEACSELLDPLELLDPIELLVEASSDEDDLLSSFVKLSTELLTISLPSLRMSFTLLRRPSGFEVVLVPSWSEAEVLDWPLEPLEPPAEADRLPLELP